jgi:hypothetical protein
VLVRLAADVVETWTIGSSSSGDLVPEVTLTVADVAPLPTSAMKLWV